MSPRLIDRSPDLKRLRDEGYEFEVVGGLLVVRHVPYVTEDRRVAFGALVCPLDLSGDITTRPSSHVIHFIGSTPCYQNGQALTKVINNSNKQELAPGLVVDHTFSSKPAEGYADYYEKITTYVAMLSGHAQAIDLAATALSFPVIEASEDESVFHYIDSASSRAGIGTISAKLELSRVAIVGLGGTGSYVLDQVAKTPVGEIHLYDGDFFHQHNAFRGPGAPSIEDLRRKPPKAEYWRDQYAKMHRYVVAHSYDIDASNVGELDEMDFVFLCLEGGAARKTIAERLLSRHTRFIDVGLGVYEFDGALAGILRVVAFDGGDEDQARAIRRLPCTDNDVENDYARNIQIADLNALNAAIAVVKWKKMLGFYVDLENERFSAYEIDGNHLINEDQA